MAYIRNTYKVTAKRGERIRFDGQLGTIVGARHGHLRVQFDDQPFVGWLHPTWRVEYLSAEREGGKA